MQDFQCAVPYPLCLVSQQPCTIKQQTHLLRRSGYEYGRAVEYLEEDGYKVVQESSVLRALAVALDIVANVDGYIALDSKICSGS
jgi:hypothetical protein